MPALDQPFREFHPRNLVRLLVRRADRLSRAWRRAAMAWRDAAAPLAVFAVVALVAPARSHGDPPTRSAEGWILTCSLEPLADLEACEISTVIEGHGAREHALRLVYSPGTGRFRTESTVTLLRVGVRIDLNFPFIFDQCDANRCRLDRPASQALLGQMRNGLKGIMKASMWRGATSPSDLPLTGFQQLLQELDDRPGGHEHAEAPTADRQ